MVKRYATVRPFLTMFGEVGAAGLPPTPADRA